MNPAQRARHLQAHNLRCQGLTYRQIAERMGCAASTAAQYVRRFEARRTEIVESLTADILVHSVAGLQGDEPDLHARHIANARELRLLLNSLDQVEDRRQRRERRVHDNNVHDAEKQVKDLEEIARIMIETGHWDVTEDVDRLFEPVFGPNAAPADAPRPREGEGPHATTAEQPHPLTSEPHPLSQDRRPREGGGPPTSTPEQQQPTSAQQPPKPAQTPPKSVHNRTQSNKTEQEAPRRPPVQAPPRPTRKKPQPRIPIPTPTPIFDEIPDPPFDLRKLRPIDPHDHRLTRLFSRR